MKRIIKKFKQILSNDKGFTFMELMIAVAIIALFAVFIGPKVFERFQGAKVTKAKTDITGMSSALQDYYMDNSMFPSTDQGLEALIKAPTTEPMPQNYNATGYLNAAKLPKDPWGKDYIYRCPGEENRPFEIESYGADGQEGGTGNNADIKSWEIQ